MYVLARLQQDRLASVKDEVEALVDSALKGERHNPVWDVNSLDLLVGGMTNPAQRSKFALRLVMLPGTNKNPQCWCTRFLLEPERPALRSALREADLSTASKVPNWAITVLGRIGDVASEQTLRDQREKVRMLADNSTDADERRWRNVLIEEYDKAITWIEVQKKPEELLNWAFDAEAKRRDPIKAWAMARALDLGVQRAEVRRVVLEYLNSPALVV